MITAHLPSGYVLGRLWPKAPLVLCAAVLGGVLPLITVFARPFLLASGAFFAALLLHLCLDTISGGILWHWPWSTQFTHFVDIPARFDNWVFNFVLHWVFTLELAIWATAFWMWKRR